MKAHATKYKPRPTQIAITRPVTPPAKTLEEAFARYQREERPDLDRAGCIRLLLADTLIGMGLLALPGANRGKGARRSAR